MTLPSLSPYSNKALICGAHRWEIKYTYLQDIYCIVKPWIQRNKSISQIKMCICGEWMVYGDDNNGENNGESLILLCSFEGIHTFLAFFETLWGDWDALYFFFLSGGYLVPLILLSDTCPFLPLVSLFLSFEVPGTCPFLFPRFLAILSRIRSRIFLCGSRDGNEWIYVDDTSGVEATYVSERASESWF